MYAYAQGQPVLHEPVAAPALQCQDGVCHHDAARRDSLPVAVQSDDKLIGAPLAGRNPQAHEPIFHSANQASPLAEALMRGAPPPGAGQDGPPIRRARMTPDGETGIEPPGERIYHEVFNPAVFPYKRMSALDAVDESGALYVADPQQRELALTANRLTAGRDPFFGSVVIDFVAGQPVALPTPAAEVHLLSYQATPPLGLYFSVDSADNLYALSARSGRHRLVYLLDAEQRYFSGPLFSGLGPGKDANHGMLFVRKAPIGLPRWLRHDAEKVLRRIGIRSALHVDYNEVLGQLVSYFRAFAVAELLEDADGGRTSLYLRIALSQRGVCRHRAYAFVITALAVGIAARYVENELHAFVEVYVPPAGEHAGFWRRINLGGAPLQQRVFGGENREAYQEKGSDPFERPPSFARTEQPRVIGKPASGTSAEMATESAGPLERSAGAGKNAPQNARAASGSRGETGSVEGHADGLASRVDSDNIELAEDSRDSVDGEALILTRVNVVIGAAREIYRRATIPVRGQVRTSRGSASGLEVVLILAAPHPLMLGRTVTRSDGSFATEVEIPAAAPLGHYQLVARVHGDQTRRGSSSAPYLRFSVPLGKASGELLKE